jgi:hypothetical protein
LPVGLVEEAFLKSKRINREIIGGLTVRRTR